MRGMMLAGIALTAGVLTMSDAAIADEPKDEKKEKKDPANKESYDEKVTVKQLASGKFLNPVENVPAFRGEIKDKMVFYIKPLASNSEAPKGSEITDKDGVVYVSEKVSKASTFHIVYVTKKP